MPMKLLVVHAWLRGNLGDVLQGSVLLRSLRDVAPATLDLAGFPSRPGEGARELLALADRHVPEPFNWYWRYAPEAARALTLEPLWRRRRRDLFSRYDAVISAPGPFLADYDARLPSALADLEVAVDLGIPFVLASHSIGPLSPDSLRRIAAATLCVAREDATHAYLAAHGLRSVRSADLAFLFPYEESLAACADKPKLGGRYRLLFLRSRNLPARRIERKPEYLRIGSHQIALQPGEQLVAATSDASRDGRFLTKLTRRLDAPVVSCRSVAELVSLVAGCSGVLSDRYHPAICAAALGKPAEILPNREPHKMLGLQALLENHPIDSIRDLARAGLSALRSALSNAATPSPAREPSNRRGRGT
jgi:polysaccharide pyruvyl transferase WcaK-like protein